MKNWIWTMLFASSVLLAGCSDDGDLVPLKRDTDAVELAYHAGATTRISVRYAGAWRADVSCQSEGDAPDWFSVSPDSGVGNGSDCQWIEVKALRNAGERREGYVLLTSDRGEQAKIKVTQADGFFQVKDPVIAGELKSNTESAARLEIAYDKAFGGEQIEIAASLDGMASEGLHIEKVYTTQIESEGSGVISLPITGVPTSLGELICHVTFKIDGSVKFEGDVMAGVSSSRTIFSMTFEQFQWGGNYPENTSGPGPNGSSGADAKFDGTEPAKPGAISAGSDGTKDLFSTMTETFRINRGIEKWDGKRAYEHPGYVKLGITGSGGWLMTPELEGLSSAPETVSVSVDFLRFDNETGTYLVTAEGAGEVLNGEVNATVLPGQTSAAARQWKTLTFTVKGATNKTRIKISAKTFDEKGCRINIDNIMVMAGEPAEVTGKLPAPDADLLTYTSGERSIALKWEGVAGATSYEVTLARQDEPDFKKTLSTEEPACEFTDLTPGLYLFTVKALYAPNREFDSDVVVKTVGTSGFVAEKLAAPSDFVLVESNASSAKFSWKAVGGASHYRIVVSAPEGGKVSEKVVQETSCVMEGLQSGRKYTAAVHALVGDGTTPSEFDSDAVSLSFETPAPQKLARPEVTLERVSHALAIVKLGYDAAQQSDTKFNLRLMEDGKVIREYTGWSFNPKYTLHATRFLFGGLEADRQYTAAVQRLSLDENLWQDSEWSAELEIRTQPAPDKSAYLLWQDFDNHPWGGHGPMLAFGIDPKDKDKSFNVITGESASGWQIASPVKNMDNLGNGVGASVEGGLAAYHSMFMSGWDSEELKLNDKNNYTGSVYLCGGMLKLGTGSSSGRITLPAFTTLGNAATLEVSFNASPYCEPNSETGKLAESPSVLNGVEFLVTVTGGGTIAEADGASVQGESVSLRNKTPEQMQADVKGHYEWTGHTLRITGASASTRVSIHTRNESSGYRMWLDDLKVKQEK